MDDAKGACTPAYPRRGCLGRLPAHATRHHCRYAPRGRYEALTRFAALQFAMPMRVGRRILQFVVGALAAARWRKMLSLHARHFERVLPVIVHNGINAGRLDDFSGLVRIFSHVISLLK